MRRHTPYPVLFLLLAVVLLLGCDRREMYVYGD